VNTKELIVSELESTSEDLLSEVLEFVKSIKRQQPISIPQSGGYANATTARKRIPNLESIASIDKAFDAYSIDRIW
jgi:hypothetical protein